MKKLWLLIPAVLLITAAAFSQHEFGVKAGVNVADQKKTSSMNPDGNRKSEQRYYYGYQAGVFYKYALSKSWTVMAELNYNVIGSTMAYQTEEMIFANREDDLYWKFGYLELPFLLQYKMKKLYVTTGPAISFNLFSRMTSFEGGKGGDVPYQDKPDISANLLMGYKFSQRVAVNVRCSYGLKNIEEGGAYAFNTKNRFLNLSLLYSFNCK